jgi:hypothetical protein
LKSKNFSVAMLLAAVVTIFAGKAFACGPDFPNNLLNGGDQAVLQAPVADFQRELERMKLANTKLRAVPLDAGQKFYEQSTELEMNDLAAALKREKISREQSVVIMQSHLAQRMKLNSYLKSRSEWEHLFCGYTNDDNGVYHELPNTNLPPIFPDPAVTPGLPREFALYFQGVISWQKGEPWPASEFWEQLLALPPSQRHFKSTWAAFMIAKYYENSTNDWTDQEAVKYLELVRTLRKSGFADSSGLATASIGEEAKIYLRQNNFEHAIELYLEQYAAGDDSAAQSLRVTAARAVAETNFPSSQLKALALNSHSRRVITAYLISRQPYTDRQEAESIPEAKQFFDRTTAWLEAVEVADVKDVECAGQLALAAYQASQMKIAQRWINRAGGEPVAQWLQAKLFMRAGKVSEAAKLLAKLSRIFPQELPGTNAASTLAESLFLNVAEYNPDRIAIGRQALGELGVLHLTRREYAESLDALLRSGYWVDAAYVAERVLTTDELKKYVDQNWSAARLKTSAQFENDYDWRFDSIKPGERLRWLLARRLAREDRFAEARSYFPGVWRTQLDLFTDKIHVGHDEKNPALPRAMAVFAASRMMRTNGIELFGTELQPDWFVEGGDFQVGVTWQDRASNSADKTINVASNDEVGRAVRHGVEPDKRWHYRELALRMRYQVADIAWDAAQTMPDNSDDTARFLCTAAAWTSDKGTADKFYTALVERCGRTLIGQQADKLRWFPPLDADGNLKEVIPWIDKVVLTAELTNSPSTNGVGAIYYHYPIPGKNYVIQAGDTLLRIARATGRIGQQVTLEQITLANPEVNPTKLRVGRLLIIPEPYR